MRKYIPMATIVAIALTIFLAGIAIAQSGALAGLVQPVIVTVEQLVPVEVTLALPQEDGSVITTTAPFTVGVSLQIKIDGNQVIAVAPAAEAEPAEVAVEVVESETDAALVDAAGRAYTIDLPAGIELLQIGSQENGLGELVLIGEVQNTGDAPLEYVEIIGTFYDADGAMVWTDSTYLDLETIEPGQSSPFRMLPSVSASDVASYRIQAQP